MTKLQLLMKLRERKAQLEKDIQELSYTKGDMSLKANNKSK